MTPRHTLAALTVMILWGVNFPIGKIGLEQLPPLTFMALRFSLVALLLVPFARRPAGRVREIAFLSFTLGLIHFSLMFTGMRFVDSAIAAVPLQIQLPFATFLGAVFFGHKLGWRRLTGLGTATTLGREPGTE